MPHQRIQRAALAILSVALLVSACDAQRPIGSPGGSTSPTGSIATGPTVGPTVTAGAQATTGTSQTPVEPPPASLAAEGGDPVAGQLGSFTWGGGGSDSPWLPGTPVSVGAAEPLTIALGGGVAVAEWSARRVPAGTTNGTGAVALGGGGAPVAFAAPGPGTWSVQVIVRFAGDLGSAAYYWQLAVR